MIDVRLWRVPKIAEIGLGYIRRLRSQLLVCVQAPYSTAKIWISHRLFSEGMTRTALLLGGSTLTPRRHCAELPVGEKERHAHWPQGRPGSEAEDR